MMQMIQAFTHVSKQWIARALALCVVGPISASLASAIVAPDGSHDTTFLTAHSGGPLTLILVLALALGFGIVVGRTIDRREAFLNIALVFGWVAWTMGRMGEAYRISPESGTLVKLALESLIIAIAVTFALVLMTNPNKGSVQGLPDDVSRFDLKYLKSSISSPAGTLSLGAAMIGALLIASLFGQTDLPGQSVGVGFGAGIAGGVAGALAATSANKDTSKQVPTPFAPIMLGVLLVGVIAPLIGLIKIGAADLLPLIAKGDLPGYLIISPLAWSIGALMGVPVGHSWIEHSVQQATTQAKTA